MNERKELDGFEQREVAAKFGYWEDPRWKEISKLRLEGKYEEANAMLCKIHDDYGID